MRRPERPPPVLTQEEGQRQLLAYSLQWGRGVGSAAPHQPEVLTQLFLALQGLGRHAAYGSLEAAARRADCKGLLRVALAAIEICEARGWMR